MHRQETFRANFREGIELFNEQQFYECHDVLEDLWLQESSDRQPLLQGIIQVAVAFHHFQHGKRGASRRMLELAMEKLESCSEVSQGVRVGKLLDRLAVWKCWLERTVETGIETIEPPFPRIELTGGTF